ncbi:MAG: GspH/FimT family pseudopilin [Burkholderiaceae bacterium]
MPRSGARTSGFTLIEVLVALVASVLMTVVGLSIRGADRSLQFDAERLAMLLSLAREEALVRGAPIRFEADDLEYRFAVGAPRAGNRCSTIATCGVPYLVGTATIKVERPVSGEQIGVGRDVVGRPFALHLARDGRHARCGPTGSASSSWPDEHCPDAARRRWVHADRGAGRVDHRGGRTVQPRAGHAAAHRQRRLA